MVVGWQCGPALLRLFVCVLCVGLCGSTVMAEALEQGKVLGFPCSGVGLQSIAACPPAHAVTNLTVDCNTGTFVMKRDCQPMGIPSILERSGHLVTAPIGKRRTNIECPASHYAREIVYFGHELSLYCEELPGGTTANNKPDQSQYDLEAGSSIFFGAPISKLQLAVTKRFSETNAVISVSYVTVDCRSGQIGDYQCEDSQCDKFQLTPPYKDENVCIANSSHYNDKCNVTGCLGGYRLNTNQSTIVRCGPDLTQSSSPHCTPCEPGFVSDDKSPTCFSCLAQDKFQDEPGRSTCKTCHAGTRTINGTSETACPKGFKCPGESCAAVPCAKGFEQPLMGQADCFKCNPGTHTNSTGTQKCELCDPGMYAPEPGTAVCLPARYGHCVPRTGAEHDTPCEPGTYAAQRGLDACRPCPPDLVQPREGQRVCRDCSPGTYRQSAAAEAACPVDSYCSQCKAYPCTNAANDFQVGTGT